MSVLRRKISKTRIRQGKVPSEVSRSITLYPRHKSPSLSSVQGPGGLSATKRVCSLSRAGWATPLCSTFSSPNTQRDSTGPHAPGQCSGMRLILLAGLPRDVAAEPLPRAWRVPPPMPLRPVCPTLPGSPRSSSNPSLLCPSPPRSPQVPCSRLSSARHWRMWKKHVSF